MSIWSRIASAFSDLSHGEGLSAALEALRKEPEQTMQFTIGVIGLFAKVAKADGQVTRDEVRAFREVFQIAERDEAHAARVYNLARQDVAGFETYAHTLARLFRHNAVTKENLLEGLFHIAVADGKYEPAEDDYIQKVADIFEISAARFRTIRSQCVPNAPRDSYDVLGVSPDMPLDEIRKVWRQAVRNTHPDQLMAQGLPAEAINLATKKMMAINTAWEEISENHELQ
ncbi:MAG: molecular chaperone DjiA [Pseudomonadota bacterium]